MLGIYWRPKVASEIETSSISTGTPVIGDYLISYNHTIEPINMLTLGLVLIALSKFGENKFRRTRRISTKSHQNKLFQKKRRHEDKLAITGYSYFENNKESAFLFMQRLKAFVQKIVSDNLIT
jgi:hypothetical protein